MSINYKNAEWKRVLMSDDIALEEAWSKFENFQHIFLATMENDRPKVRPVTLIHFDKRFWITTDTTSAKVNQIQKNPKVEFSFQFKEKNRDCCLRVAGTVKIVKDRATKTKIANHCDFFSHHWKSVDDPGYTLLEVCPSEVIYVSPEKTTHIRI
jgi:general stress protein 26